MMALRWAWVFASPPQCASQKLGTRKIVETRTKSWMHEFQQRVTRFSDPNSGA